MVNVTCTYRFRDKYNNVKGYRIQDSMGATRDISSGQLKLAIKNGRINVTNLTLTSDNRLVDKVKETI